VTESERPASMRASERPRAGDHGRRAWPGNAVNENTLVLGIETSCDETAAALVMGGNDIASSVVSSQIDQHAAFGGVVPEIASRAHLDLINPVIARAIVEAGVDERRIDAVACTVGPGLIGALLVGVSAAKALALAWDVPFVGVNHLEAHLYAALLEDPSTELPIVVLLVSGGHTMLVEMTAPGEYRLLGQTIDDAAGEAFDKVARFLGLGYPGGPAIEAAARRGDPGAIAFPRAMRDVEGDSRLDFSFSGLKTAVLYHVRKHPDADTADIAASFQEAVVDVLVHKARRAAAEVGAQGVALGGGVAANGRLREAMISACAGDGIRCYVPSPAMCTDNAAMIAAAGWHRLRRDGPTPLDAGAVPNLKLA
jgi:N6-L-threonylcarbamoyladenine synthase